MINFKKNVSNNCFDNESISTGNGLIDKLELLLIFNNPTTGKTRVFDGHVTILD